jgi:alpha-L-rhamnosidase
MYPTMESLLAFYAVATHADDGLMHPWSNDTWTFLGDWITPHGSEGVATSNENILFNNCYLHYITTLVAKISTILGEHDMAAKYEAAAAKLATAVTKKFADPSTGVYLDRLQTHLMMPLAAGLVPASLRNLTMASLATAIVDTGTKASGAYPARPKGHIDTGLTGTYFLTKLLMESGRNDLIFTFANQTTYPGYGHFLQQGYTTWPEQWNLKSKSLSKMHGCFNGIGLWFVEGVAGIRVHASEDPPLTIRAGVDAGDITWAAGKRQALTGIAKSAWLLRSDGAAAASFTHNLTVPANGLAKVMIPSTSGTAAELTEGGKPLKRGGAVRVLAEHVVVNAISYVSLLVPSGDYCFGSAWRRSSATRSSAMMSMDVLPPSDAEDAGAAAAQAEAL